MEEAQTYPPKSGYSESSPGRHVVLTPIWVLVVRALQFIFAIAILAICVTEEYDRWGAKIKPLYGLGISVSVFTWIFTLYAVLTERISVLGVAYHIYTIVAMDALLLLLWLTFVILAPIEGDKVENYSAKTLGAFQLIFSTGLLVTMPFLSRQERAAPSSIEMGSQQPYTPAQPYAQSEATQGYSAPTAGVPQPGGTGGMLGRIKGIFSLSNAQEPPTVSPHSVPQVYNPTQSSPPLPPPPPQTYSQPSQSPPPQGYNAQGYP